MVWRVGHTNDACWNLQEWTALPQGERMRETQNAMVWEEWFFFFLTYGRRKLRKMKRRNQSPRALQKWYDFSRALGGKNLKAKMVVK